MNSALLPHLLVMFCTTYKYRICIAELVFKIYEVSFRSFADSTSAFAAMIVASEVRFWIAADCRFFCTSAGRITSEWKLQYP